MCDITLLQPNVMWLQSCVRPNPDLYDICYSLYSHFLSFTYYFFHHSWLFPGCTVKYCCYVDFINSLTLKIFRRNNREGRASKRTLKGHLLYICHGCLLKAVMSLSPVCSWKTSSRMRRKGTRNKKQNSKLRFAF